MQILSITRLFQRTAILCYCLLLASCGDKQAPQGRQAAPSPEIAVSNSWLECCLRDLQGDTAPLTRVCPPGTCPGEFDIRPATVVNLRDCRLLFLFDFQQSLNQKLESISPRRLKTIAVVAPEGLCVPENYLVGCQAIHAALCAAYPERRLQYEEALKAVQRRIATLEKEIHEQIRSSGLLGARVVASGHQAEFCRWLGLNPIAAYSGPETASPRQIDALLSEGKSSGVRFVIANLQESAQAGAALASQLGVPVVVFSNFPSMKDGNSTFDSLVRSNVRYLLKAAAKAR